MSGRVDHYVDIDALTVKPSSQRIRNILTLEERVAAIEAYAVRPMYTKVAKMFNCSWEQIKNIIANRQAILEFYDATKNAERQMDPQLDEARKRKLEFLGECVYEYIQRLQYHNKVDFNEELIRCKALEFRDIIRIDGFVPNKAWINQFKATYNFSLSNRQLRLTRAPPNSLDLRYIMTYCSKMKSQQKTAVAPTPPPGPKHVFRTSTMISLHNESEMIAEQLHQRRQRKLNFLERALLEFATRSKFHQKVTIDDERLLQTASSLRDILKVDNFQPNPTWLKSFKVRYDFDMLVQGNLATSTRTPPLSLDLRDILSYCSRLEKNSQIGAADNLNGPINAAAIPKSPTVLITPKKMYKNDVPAMNIPAPRGERKQNVVKTEIIDLAEDEESPIEPAISDDLEIQPPALKIRRIESMCAGKEMSYDIPHSPGHWSEPSDKDINDEALPSTVRNYVDALKLLKPLEEFAMLEENYRAIGLIEQLESIFKNPPSKDDDGDN